MFCVGRPADAADRLGELELAVASSMTVGRVGARAVDRYDCRPVRYDDVNDLPARQVALERQNPAIIDDRYVETLPLCAHINASPHSHASKHAPPPVPLALWLSTQALTDPRLPSLRPPLRGRTQWPAKYPALAGTSSELWSYKTRMARPGRSARSAAQMSTFATRATMYKNTAWRTGPAGP